MADPDPPINVPPPVDRPAVADTSSLVGSTELNPDPSPPSGVNLTPAAPTARDVSPAMTPVPRVPMQWKPKYRSGIAGLVDEIRDAIAGPSGHQTYTDQQGNEYVGAAPETGRSQWLRAAAHLAQGAASGYAAGQGVGGQGRAAVAGFQNVARQQEQQRQQTKELTAEARQQNQERFNNAKQQLDLATSTLNLQRLKASTSHDEVEFSQKQIAWHKEQGDIPIAVIPDWQHPDAARQADPDFFKHLYQDQTVSGVPIVNENGERGGIQVFLKTQDPKNSIIPAGHEIARYNPPKKPGDEATITYEKTSAPMSAQAFETQNNDAQQKLHDWQKQVQGDKMQAVELENKKADTKEKNANAVRQIAAANKDNADARKLRIEADMEQGDQAGNLPTDPHTQAQMLVDDRMAPSQLNKRAKNYNQTLMEADALSRQQKGYGYDAERHQMHFDNIKGVRDEYSHKKTADDIASFDMFLGHAYETSQLVSGARNTGVRWLNTPINKLKVGAGTKNSGDFMAFQQSLETTQREYQNFLNHGHVIDKRDKEKMDAILDDSATPAQVQEGLKTYGKLAATRLRGLDFNYMRVVGEHVPNLISPQSAAAFDHFGVRPQEVYTTLKPTPEDYGPGGTVPGAAPGAPAAAPTAAPTGGPKIATKAQVQAFADAHKMTYDQAKEQVKKENYQVQE